MQKPYTKLYGHLSFLLRTESSCTWGSLEEELVKLHFSGGRDGVIEGCIRNEDSRYGVELWCTPPLFQTSTQRRSSRNDRAEGEREGISVRTPDKVS